MKKILLAALVLLTSIAMVSSQEDNSFKPSGKIIARSFFDYSIAIDDHNNNQSGFDITRAFLGYDYQITRNLSARVIIDGASGNSDGNLDVYLRNAYLTWKEDGLKINLGLTGLLQFSKQEEYWKHRYVLKSFQDLNKMAPSVDMGFTVEYDFTHFLSADFSLTNGEGYKNISKDNSTRYALGLGIKPLDNFLLRVYADVYNQSRDMRDGIPEGVENTDYKNQYTLSFLAGYQNQRISFGAEYNRLYNKGFIENKDYYGCSFYASVKANPKWSVFARYDWMDSKIPAGFTSPWNNTDGQLMIAGVEFKPVKQLKIAPNIRNINPDRKKSEQYIFMNFEFNL